MKNKQIGLYVLIGVIVAGAAFFGGMKYQESRQLRPFNSAFGMGRGGFGQDSSLARSREGGMGGGGSRQVMGEVLSMDANTMTVKMPDGSSRIVILSQTTTYNKSAEGSKEDIRVGTRVAAFGATNPDGSVTAQMVSLNPIFRGVTNTPPKQ